MSRTLMGLALVFAVGLVFFPALAGEVEAVPVDGVAVVAGDTCEQAVTPVAFGLEVANLELQPEKVEMMTPCPDWTCTRPLQCGYECGGVSPSCHNPSGGICTGSCVCP